MGIINVGGEGTVQVDGTSYQLQKKDALYVSRGTREVIFSSSDGQHPALFYFNSATAHHSYPTRHVKQENAIVVELGDVALSNRRKIYKLLVNEVLDTCQLQMGLTELQPGNVWNTMPAHVHLRRCEAYYYFDLQPDGAVCHLMGEAEETRHIWLKNHQAVLSPPWSIHAGCGVSNYTFIWGMSGENLDYGDMDVLPIQALK